MLQSERSNDEVSTFKLAFRGQMRGVWTAIPAIVVSYNAGDNTVTCQPAIRVVIRDLNVDTGKESQKTVDLPQLIKVPVIQYGAGGFCLDIKPTAGDEVLVVFGARCIDGWWQSGGVQGQIEQRAHDLSDGMAIPGLWSVPRVPSSIGGGGLRIRSVDGASSVGLAAGNIVNIVAPGGINVTGNLTVIGNLTTTGTMLNNSVNMGSTHVHGGVAAGGANSAVPH